MSRCSHGRLGELAAAFALLVFALLLPTAQYHNLPPEHSAQLSFPVKLRGTWCSARALAPNATGACAAEKAAGTRAWMQVSTASLGLMALVMPIAWLVAQHWRAVRRSGGGGATARAQTAYPFGGKLCAWRDGSVGLMLALAIAALLTNAIKRAAGRPRPNFYALMALDPTFYGGAAYRSFPSGHASASMAGLHFLALWLRASAVTCLAPSAHRGVASLVLGCAVFAPTALAVWVAVTRIQDHWHGYADVLAGSLIGFAAAHRGFMHAAAHAASAGHRFGVYATLGGEKGAAALNDELQLQPEAVVGGV